MKILLNTRFYNNHHPPGGVAPGERREDMYRQYENPRTLQSELKALKEEYKRLLEQDADEDALISMHEHIADLEERVNFAWQDEYEC